MSTDLLYKAIIGLSEEKKNIGVAIDEWRAEFSHEESTSCICGHRILKVFRATNILNSNVLEPIGSVCIRNFCKEYELCSSEFFKAYEQSLRVMCPDCGISIINESAFNIHTNTKKHLRNVGSWPCLDCGVRIERDKPEWMTRCFKCYKTHHTSH